MEYTRKQLANMLNTMGFRTRNNTIFDDTSIAHILRKLKIKHKKSKLITYIDRRSGTENVTQAYIYDEEDKNKIIKYAKKTYKNINNSNNSSFTVDGKQIEISNTTTSVKRNNQNNDDISIKYRELQHSIKVIKDAINNSSLKINEYYYKGAYDGVKRMYNELSSKYDNLYAKYSKVLEEKLAVEEEKKKLETHYNSKEEIKKKSFWRRLVDDRC